MGEQGGANDKQPMARSKSWSVKGVDDETRDLARAAAQASGVAIGTWIDEAILRAGRGELPGIAAVAGQSAASGQAAPRQQQFPPESDTGAAPGTSAPQSPEPPSTEKPPAPLAAVPEDRLFATPPDEGDAPAETTRRSTVPANEPPSARPLHAAEPVRPRPLPVPPTGRRPGLVRYVATAAALAAILAGGVWIFLETTSPDKLPGQGGVATGQQSAPGEAGQNGTTAATGAPTSAAPGDIPTGLPENVRVGIEMARSGDARAQHDLGLLYLAGRYVPKDEAEAARWFEKAAVQGLAPAQFNLGVLYQTGQGVEQNLPLAFFWFQSAAEQNEPRAQHNLAAAYAEGRGVARNYDQAIDWFTKAANAGLARSQYSLARLYETGTPEHLPDIAKARYWYEKAAAQGDADAAERLAALNAVVTAKKPIDRLDDGAPPAASASVEPAPIPAEKPDVPDTRPITRAEIREAQQLLAKLNFDPGPADGLMGKRTAEAIELFQKFAGLEATGEVTRSLLEELRAVAKMGGN